jgi:ABC-2 type transport system permease protein
MKLLGVELRRFWWRRSFRVFGLVALAGISLAAFLVAINSDPAPQGAQAQQERIIEECESNFPADAVPRRFDSVEEFCRDTGPSVEMLDPRFHLTTLGEIFGGTSVPLIILGLAFGASFIGAEWHAGTITPLLTWRPRRVPVLVTKAVAAALGVFIFAVCLQSILGILLWFVAAVRGTTEGVDGAWFVDTVGVALRGATISGLASMLGFSIATIARNTTVALIIGFVYFAVAEAFLRAFRPGWQEWLVGDNAAAFVVAEPGQIFGMGRSTTASLLVVVAYAAGGLALATAWFQSRDVN